MKKWLLGGLAVALVGWAAYVLTSGGGKDVAQQGIVAPDFTFPDLQGKPVSLSNFRGKVVFLDFWATWCGPCQDEIPDLKKLYAKYKGQGFVIVGVSMDSMGRDIVAPFVKAHGIDYPILVSGGDPPPGYPVPGFPTGFLIDRQGMVRARYVGEMTADDLSKDIEDALAR